MQYGYHNLTVYFQNHPELNIPAPEAISCIFRETIVGFILSQEVLLGKHTIPMKKERLIKSLIRCILGDIATKEISD